MAELETYMRSVLYDGEVRLNIDRLREADEQQLKSWAEVLSEKRLQWYTESSHNFKVTSENAIQVAYHVLLQKLSISREQAPIVRCDEKQIIFHSNNFCPTLEACKILSLDTRFVCKHLTEKPTTDLIRKIHPKLKFTRNYEKLRPYVDYCEEKIILEG